MSAKSSHQRFEIPAAVGPRQAATWFAAWSEVKDALELSLVLTPKTSLEPAGLTWLASGIAARSQAGLATRFELDASADNARYLERIDFFRVLGIDAPEALVRTSAAGRFVELRRIETEQIAETIAHDTVERIRAQVDGLPSSVRRAAKFILEELGVNIVQHSRAPRTGFGLAEVSPQNRSLQISFCDAGIGFLASVRRHPEFGGRVDDEGDALQLAIKDGVSFSESGANMGVGLGFLRSFSDQLNAELWIASGDSLLHRQTVNGQRLTRVRITPPWSGAWVCLEAPLPTVESRDALPDGKS